MAQCATLIGTLHNIKPHVNGKAKSLLLNALYATDLRCRWLYRVSAQYLTFQQPLTLRLLSIAATLLRYTTEDALQSQIGLTKLLRSRLGSF